MEAVLNVFKICNFSIFVNKYSTFSKKVYLEESQDQIYKTDCLLLRAVMQWPHIREYDECEFLCLLEGKKETAQITIHRTYYSESLKGRWKIKREEKTYYVPGFLSDVLNV